MRITRSIVPNLFTLVNLFAGFSAIIHISNGDYWRATLFILIAGVFDLLDGAVARILNSTSEFGVELDSLCDAVSFGVAPSYLLYSIHFHQYGETGILISSLPAIAGVVRLARFNVKQATLEEKKYFIGLPIPSNAILIFSYVLFVHLEMDLSENLKSYLIVFATLISSGAMVSNIKFDVIPKPTLNYIRKNRIQTTFFLISIAGTIFFGGKFIFLSMAFYIVASSVRYFINWIIESRTLADELDETEEPEPGPFDI